MKLSKKFNKIKIISLVFLSVFSLMFFTGNNKASAASCVVESAKWVVPNYTIIKDLPSDWFNNDNPPSVKIDVILKNCAGQVAEISIVEDDTVGIDDDIAELDDMEISIPNDNYTFSISLKAGETDCENSAGNNNDCEYFIKVDLAGLTNNYSSDNKTNGNLKYECDGASIVDPYPCDKDWSFGSTTGPKAPAGECQIVSAIFDPKGKQESGWFKESNRPDVTMIIKTKKCEGHTIDVSITEDGVFWDTDVSEFNTLHQNIDSKYTDPKTGINTIQYKMKAGETNCASVQDPDCQYYITVNPPGWDNEFDSKSSSTLSYNCDGACQDNISWSYGPATGSVAGVELPPSNTTGDGSQQQSDLQATGKYDLLAPLPNFGKTFDIEGGLTPYLQILFRLLIGIAGLLAVIMIVLGGIEYMSTDAISGKEEGKERVTQAILGLIIALGAWLLLNTINPDLLSLKFNPGDKTITSSTTTPLPPGGGGSGYSEGDGLAGYNNAKGSCPHTNKITVEHFKMSGNVFVSSHSEVQKNLNALAGAFNELRAQVLKDYGFGVTSSSAYRTRTYQRHFWEVFSLYNELINNNKPECASLKQWVIEEKNNKHGIQGNVASPDTGCGGPHTLGVSIDLGPKNRIGQIVESAKKLAATKSPGQPYLRQGNIDGTPLPNDIVHFSLVNAPVGCPKEPLP